MRSLPCHHEPGAPGLRPTCRFQLLKCLFPGVGLLSQPSETLGGLFSKSQDQCRPPAGSLGQAGHVLELRSWGWAGQDTDPVIQDKLPCVTEA